MKMIYKNKTMKKIFLLVIISLGVITTVQSQEWIIINNGLYLKNGNDTVYFGSHSQAEATMMMVDHIQQAKVNIDILAYQMLGCVAVAETVGQKLMYSNVSTALVDGQIKYTAVCLPKFEVLDGIRVYVRVLGSYTGDQNNRVGLYSYNINTGLLTLVASSANSATLWTSAANAGQTIPFSASYNASPGIYFVAFIYNNSAQTTAPSLASGIALNNVAMGSTAYGFTNSAKLYGTSTGTDLPATINMSGITASLIPSWVAIY